MKDDEIVARVRELDKLFTDIPDDVLMRYVNRNGPVCDVFSRLALLRVLAGKPNSGREQLKAFLCKSVPEVLRKKPECFWETKLKNRYEKYISCGGACVFDPPLPEKRPTRDSEYAANAQEVARRDRELLKKLQQNDEIVIRRELLDEAEFNTACGDSQTARAEAAFRDGLVRAKLAELERYVREQMAELRRETEACLESLRREVLPSVPAHGAQPDPARQGTISDAPAGGYGLFDRLDGDGIVNH